MERKRTLAFGAALLPLPPAAVEAVVRAVLAGPLRSLRTHVLCCAYSRLEGFFFYTRMKEKHVSLLLTASDYRMVNDFDTSETTADEVQADVLRAVWCECD